jgi:hypothetical protein
MLRDESGSRVFSALLWRVMAFVLGDWTIISLFDFHLRRELMEDRLYWL